MGGKNHMVDYLSDDEGGGTLLAPQTPAPDWSIGGTFDHPPSDSGGEAEEAAPASPACSVCFSASHGPLVYTEWATRRTFGVLSYDGGLFSARTRYSSGF